MNTEQERAEFEGGVMKNSTESFGIYLLATFIAVVIFFFAGQVARMNKGTDPYAGCSLISVEKTGKSKDGGLQSRSYELVKTWRCKNGNKLQVTWGRI